MFGLEAQTEKRRAFGGGQTARPGKSHSGHRANQTARSLVMEMENAWIMCSSIPHMGPHIITSGTIGTAAVKLVSCAARRFAQVNVIKIFHAGSWVSFFNLVRVFRFFF